MNRSITFFLAFATSTLCYSQGMKLDMPLLAKETVVAYYATALGIDSVAVTLDTHGQSTLLIDKADYQGLIQVGNQSGMVEIFYSDKEQPTIKSTSVQLNQQSISIDNSLENHFIRNILHHRTQITQSLQWLLQGKQLFPENKALETILLAEQTKDETKLDSINIQLRDSELTAPRIIYLMDYVQKLNYATKVQDGSLLNEIKDEMEQYLDIDALSSNLSLQDPVFRGYISLYLRVQNGEEYYAQSILQTTKRLEEPLRLFYLKNSLMMCQQAGWKGAQNKILATMLTDWSYYLETPDTAVQRMIEGYKMQHGDVKLRVNGLEADQKYSKTLLFFYESDCNLCKEEIEVLKTKYKALKAFGIRLVSISADRDFKLFEQTRSSFPWKDKLNDWQEGTEGNLARFGVLTTPNYILLGKDSKFEESFMRLRDFKIIKN